MKKSYLFSLSKLLIGFPRGLGAIFVTSDLHLLLRIFIADVFATAVIFLFSVGFKNSSFYDPYWSIVPVLSFSIWLIRMT